MTDFVPALQSPTPSDLTPKPPSASFTDTVQIVFPQDANPVGTVFGGRVMQWIDGVAAMAAQRHSHHAAVTASMDALDFKAPIYIGEYAVLRAFVNRSWGTSMEIEVRVEAEHPLTGERRKTADAFLTFVAIGPDGKPVPVAPVQPETEEEWERYHAADIRRQVRLAMRKPRA